MRRLICSGFVITACAVSLARSTTAPATAPSAVAPRVSYDESKDLTTISAGLEDLRIDSTYAGRKLSAPCTRATISFTYRPESNWTMAIFLLDGGKRFPVVLRAGVCSVETGWLRDLADNGTIEIALLNTNSGRHEFRVCAGDIARLNGFLDASGCSRDKLAHRRSEAATREAARVDADRRIAGIDATDKRVVLMVDRSGSMTNHFADVTPRVRWTVELLLADQQFTVIAVSDNFDMFSATLAQRSDRIVQKALLWIDQIPVFGDDAGFADAFKQALEQKPDLIVLFSDGDVNIDSAQAVVDTLQDAHRRLNLVVFAREADSNGLKLLTDLSKRSGGSVRLVTVE